MRYSQKKETSILHTLTADPMTCLVMNDDDYRRGDGVILVNRDGLQESLHRRLYRQIVDPHLGRKKLHRTCESWGCINPRHYRLGQTLVGNRDHCPQGHLYLPGNLTEGGHCLACVSARRQARQAAAPSAAEVNAAKTHCPQGHPYTPENTYIYRDARGTHRICKVCKRARTTARRKEVALSVGQV